MRANKFDAVSQLGSRERTGETRVLLWDLFDPACFVLDPIAFGAEGSCGTREKRRLAYGTRSSPLGP
jgi:hypothetical protein